MNSLVIALTCHFVGDFLLQSDWMATNKSKQWAVLAIHVSAYCVPFLAWFMLARTANHAALVFVSVTWAAHFVTDAITSRVTSRLWFVKTTLAGRGGRVIAAGVATEAPAYWVDYLPTRHWFFVVIGFDQLLHIWQLAATLAWLNL